MEPVESAPESEPEPSETRGRGGIRGLLSGRGLEVGGVAVTSISGGLVEALFLVIVTRLAFSIADQEDTVGLVAGAEVTTGAATRLVVVLVILRLCLAVATTWQTSRLNASVSAGIRRDLAHAFMKASWAAQHGDRTGRLQELLTTFAQRGSELLAAVLATITSGFSLAALLGSAIAVDPLGSIVVIGSVAVIGSILRPLRSAVKRQAHRSAQAGMEFATGLSETSQLGMEMHVFNVQPQATNRIDELIDRTEVMSRRLGFRRNLVTVVYTGIAYLALVGALAVVAAIDSAELTSIGAVMLIMLRSLSYGQALQNASATISATAPFVGSLDEELSHYRAAQLIDHGQPIRWIGPLHLSDVSFEYETGSPVLQQVEATIDPGEVIGVIGPSGSGKSTLVQLLLGLRDPTSGVVLADGRDIRVLSRTEWARKVTFVPQEAHLIAGTIADNIRFMRDGVSLDDIEQAARMANLHADVAAMPEGYDRQVGERGSHLSGGQQQRLIIARALVERPDVLILDEPTSSLDVRSEHLIRQTLDGLREHMTIIIIAHRLSTLDSCDRLMVIADGELVGFDTPDNLEKDNDFYREALTLSGLR